MITYTLDANDTLTGVGGAWDEFARENHGDGIIREYVVGKPLFRFIQGAEVVAIYKALFAKSRREQKPLSFTFRCDAPSCRRKMKFDIATAARTGGSRCKRELSKAHKRAEVRLLDAEVPRTQGHLTMCCICANVKSEGGQWVAIETESTRLGLFRTGRHSATIAFVLSGMPGGAATGCWKNPPDGARHRLTPLPRGGSMVSCHHLLAITQGVET